MEWWAESPALFKLFGLSFAECVKLNSHKLNVHSMHLAVLQIIIVFNFLGVPLHSLLIQDKP